MIEDEEEFEGGFDDEDAAGDVAGMVLAHHLEEAYAGDARLDYVLIAAPGALDDEDLRVQFVVNDAAQFVVGVFSELGVVRIGLAVEEEALSERIEAAALEAGSLTDFLAEGMESEDELEFEVEHFHDDLYYFCSEIPFDTVEQLKRGSMREQATAYLEGYLKAFGPLIG